MDYDEYTTELVNWLKAQEADALILWQTDHMTAEYPYCGSWVDVILPDFVEQVGGSNWQFTVVHVNDPDLEERRAWEFPLETDKMAYGVFNPNPPDFWYIEEVILNNGVERSADLVQHLDEVVSRIPGSYLSKRGVWSPAQISEGLNRWAAKYADRADLFFVWNPHAEPSPQLQQAIHTMEKIKSGEAKTYEIGETSDGLKILASDQAMDFLLSEMIKEEEQ